MKLKILLLMLFSTFTIAQSIKVAVAANVSYAIDDLKKEFKTVNSEYATCLEKMA